MPFIKLSKQLCLMYFSRGGLSYQNFTDCPLEYKYHTRFKYKVLFETCFSVLDSMKSATSYFLLGLYKGCIGLLVQ